MRGQTRWTESLYESLTEKKILEVSLRLGGFVKLRYLRSDLYETVERNWYLQYTEAVENGHEWFNTRWTGKRHYLAGPRGLF